MTRRSILTAIEPPTPPLPDTDTILFQRNHLQENPGTVEITIPAGCNVLEITLIVNADAGDGNDPEASAEGTVVNVINRKIWNNLTLSVPQFEYATETRIQYVGVTAGKTYYVNVIGYTFGGGYAHVMMKYSQSINNRTPNVTDY